MTREEVKSCIGTIEMLQRLAYNIHGVMDVIDADNCKKIIKALEQEPCEECVSRQAVIDTIYAECSGTKLDIDFAKVLLLQRAIKALPSAIPQEPKIVPVAEIKFDKDKLKELVDKAVLTVSQSYVTEVLDKIREEISEYGSIWVAYAIKGKSDEDIEQLVSDVLSQAKKQVLEIIDKYKVESEERDDKA